jgi:hypothetical protein
MTIGSNPHSKFSLFIVLAIAVSLILLFNIGVGLQQTLSISASSRSIVRLDPSAGLWTGLAETTHSVGLRKTILSLPTAILYWVGGISDITTQAYPILSTLGNVVLVYALANILSGKKAGWLAAFLFIALPVTLFTATAFPLTQPILVFALCLLLVFTRRGLDRNWVKIFGIILFLIILLVMDFLLALCLLGLILTVQLFESGYYRLAWLLAAMLFASLIVWTSGNIGNVFVDFYDNLLRVPEIELLLPITFTVLILTLWQTAHENFLPLALLVVSFGGLLWRSSMTVGSELSGDPLFSLLLLAVTLMISRLFSTRHTVTQNHIASIWMPLAFITLTWITVGSQKLLIPDYEGFAWISWQSLLPVLRILPGPIFLLFIAYSLFGAQKNTELVRTFSVILPFLLAIALIPYAWQRWHTNQPSIQAVILAKDVIAESDLTLPIFVVDDARVVSQLDYLWNDAPPSPVTPVTLDTLESELSRGGGYILYWEDAILNLPSNWWQLGVFGTLGQPRLVVARALDEAEASRILGQVSATTARLKEDFEKIVGAAINAGNPCLAFSVWIESRRSGAGTQNYFPVFDFPLESCLNLSESENLLTGLEPVIYPGYNPPVQYLGEEKNLQEGASLGPKYPFYDDPRVFYLKALLDANSIYAYHVELRGVENLMPLYWNIGGVENYLDYGLYRDWTLLTVLISTYGLEDEPISIMLSPFMYYVTHYGGSVELRNLQFFKVEQESGAEQN